MMTVLINVNDWSRVRIPHCACLSKCDTATYISHHIITIFHHNIYIIIIIELMQHEHEKRLRSLRQEHDKVKLKYLEIVNNTNIINNNLKQQQPISTSDGGGHVDGGVGIGRGSSNNIVDKIAHTSPHLVNTRESSAQRIRL